MTRIEDYGLIGDTHTAALVSNEGSIDWLCLPRFDSPACFAALLGTPENGHWSIQPVGPARSTVSYVGKTLVHQIVFSTPEGEVELLDFMPVPSSEHEVDVVRVVKGRSGRVDMEMEFIVRFDYGSIVPWVRRRGWGLEAIAGPNAIELRSPVELENEDFRTRARFSVAAGEVLSFELTWYPSHREPSHGVEPMAALGTTLEWWEAWAGHHTNGGEWHDLVTRSLVTLKALTYSPTGGMVAAATTSLPEHIGSSRNWDYRYCWLRDATFTLYAMLISGYDDEARAWERWLMRAVAGKPDQMQIMFGVAGERLLFEHEIDWLPGYENSRPVRVGNGAHRQFQLDVYGELMDSFHVARRSGIEVNEAAWHFQKQLMGALEDLWQLPDEGLWEVRGPQAHFTHSKLMAWVGFDRAVKAIERYGLPGPLARWRALREQIHAEICERGFDRSRNTFVQAYGSDALDAALLMMPLVGFLPGDDPRITGTINAVRTELSDGVFVRRYKTRESLDGLPPGEGTFLPCTFWLADALILNNRYDEGRHVFEQAIGACSPLGLLSEEFDPVSRRQLGNFPQAFSHIGLINTAQNLNRRKGPAVDRATT
ncbi:MAG: glycoside hydrolase family 15 protein [Dehalococcoidia bacterium]